MKPSLLILAALCGAAFAAPSSGSCSDDCIQYILSDPSGPKVLRLYKELLKHDVGAATTPVDVNGRTYDVSYPKKSLIQNAINKGVRESVIENMLDDAAILPSGTSSRHTQHHQQTAEPSSVQQRRPAKEPLNTQGRYKIYTKTNGDINIDINGQTLRFPDYLTRLAQVAANPETLEDITKQLQELGVPITKDGNRITVQKPVSPQGLTLRVSIRKIDDKPSSVTITANEDKYTLPGDEYRLNRYLAREPDVAYHILRILSSHGVPVEYDSQTKTLKTQLTPEEELIGSRTGASSHSQSGASPSAQTPKVVRVGTASYYLPEDWDRLKRDIQDGRISARTALDVLETENISPPGDVYSAIRTKLTNSVGRVRVMRYGDSVTVEIGSQQYRLPNDERALEKALKDNEFPIELIRDSLLRIGVDSRRTGSSLRVLLPEGDAYLTSLPTTKTYDYKITPKGNDVQVKAGAEIYNLPADQLRLESDMGQKKVLPRTLVDAFNDAGIFSKMDLDKQEMTVNLPSGTVRIPVPLNVHKHTLGSRLRLSARGPEGNKVYTLTVGDAGTDKIELPLETAIVNSYIRSGKVDSALLLQLLSRMGVAHYFDSAKNRHIATMNGRTYEIEKSERSSGGFITEDCPLCSSERYQPYESHQQVRF